MIVDKFLTELEAQLREKKVELEVSIEAKEWMAETGYDPKLGARPISRLIEDKIKKVLAKEVLFGALAKGGVVKIYLKENDLKFEYMKK